MSGPVAVLMVAVVAVSALALLAVLVVYLVARGSARAGLGSFGVAAASLAPVTGIGAASYALTQRFSRLAASDSGDLAAVPAGCAEAALLIRVGCAAAALTLVVASVLGWIGRGEATRRCVPPRPAGWRRSQCPPC